MQPWAITEDPERSTYLLSGLSPLSRTDADSPMSKVHVHSTHSSALWGIHLHVSNTAHQTNIELLTRCHWFHTVPLEQLQVLFTFFSKFFSPFVHTTSSLSVSQEYLALDEIYHLFRVAIPNNPTREKLDTYWTAVGDAYGILTLSDALFQRTYSHKTTAPWLTIQKLQFGVP